MEIEFSERDTRLMASMNIVESQVRNQIRIFQRGIPPANIVRPCTAGDGIRLLPETQFASLQSHFDRARLAGRIQKFVPASGAASRMFKSLLASLVRMKSPDQLSDARESDLLRFIDNLPRFAFCGALESQLRSSGQSLKECISSGNYRRILQALLHPAGMGYRDMPKALIEFHRYGSGVRTAFEEHIVEGITLCADQSATLRLHMTIPAAHEEKFIIEIDRLCEKYQFPERSIIVNYSFQKTSTNTIAVDLQNQPFRDEDGGLLFRPGGHGALLENLNEMAGDIVLIKNVDNVVPDHLKAEIYRYQKVMGGLLLSLQERIFGYLKRLQSHSPDRDLLDEISKFASADLGLQIAPAATSSGDRLGGEYLFDQLNRPIRVCAMVKNSGEPGGGPFWVQQTDGTLSCQIVESAQIDASDHQQNTILKKSTHFNPVDIICGLRDFQGTSFDLRKFSDPESGFISNKSFNGRDLKALELPGLWNGAMAHWITIFVEVPESTFNPVKTVFDLLRKEHQPA